MKRTAGLTILPAVFLCAAHGAKLPDGPVVDPTAVATIAESTYCFGRVRGLDPGRLPPAYLVLQLKVKVSYLNSGTRSLILPLQHDRTIYTALKPGAMTVFHEAKGLFEPAYKKAMTSLPSSVSPVDPLEPKNDFFTVIPASGAMSAPLLESVTIPVNRKFLFRQELDLRGRKLYFVIQLAHRDISPSLDADLSDLWSRFGVPWTGVLRTNTFAVDIPADPKAKACDDSQSTLR